MLNRSGSGDPRLLLCLAAALLAFVVQSGELGSADTMHRLQTAHSFWTSEPAVFPNEYPEFGVHGRGGKLYDWYGIGQPLLMLPADIVGSYIEKLPIFADYRGNDPTVRNIFVTYTTTILVSVLTALVCFRFLQLFEFTVSQSIAGVLALLFCTTHLHYTQNMMENNYICLLTVTGLCYQYEWLRSGSRRALLIGSAAFGLNLLTRLTSVMDLFLWRSIPAAGSLVRKSGEGRILAETCYLLEDRASRVRVFPAYRPAVSVCSVRNLDGHVRSLLCIGAPAARPHSAGEVSLGDAVPRGILGAADLAGEVDLPF